MPPTLSPKKLTAAKRLYLRIEEGRLREEAFTPPERLVDVDLRMPSEKKAFLLWADEFCTLGGYSYQKKVEETT